MSEDSSRKFYDRALEVCERLAKIETILSMQEETNKKLAILLDNHEKRIASLEGSNAKFFGIREFIAWVIAVGIGIAGVVMR